MEAGFEIMETYILRRQNMFVQYIVAQLIMYLCEAVERKQRARVRMQWL